MRLRPLLAALLALAPLPASAAPEPGTWTCEGTFTPPTGWEQETVSLDKATPNARQAALDEARRRLLARLCSRGSCEALAAKISPWKTGEGASQVCAMAVVSSEDLAAWRRQLALGLDQQLAHAAHALLQDETLRALKSRRVAIDRIVDNGKPGGRRAEWLRLRLERALADSGATIVEVPRGWGGERLPKNVDLVVRANAVSRRDAERQLPVVEVDWFASVLDAHRLMVRRPAPPFEFPEESAPAPEAEVAPALPAASAALSVHLDARPGGSLCRGERSQIYVHSDKALHVRVYDLYGQGQALLLFPNADHPSDLIPAGQTVPLGGELGFEADPVPGSAGERFLVVGAEQPEGLGALRRATDYCRVRPELARQLGQGQGLPPGAEVASDGFRLLEGGACSPPPQHAEGAAAAIDALPECP